MAITLQTEQYEMLDTFINNATNKLSEQAKKCAMCRGIEESEYENYAIIKIESYYNITKIIDDFLPIEISEIVYPFDEEKIYPMQEIKLELSYVIRR